jgi:predicted nucleic acid-binding protein
MSGKVNLDRWSPHLAAAKREGKSLTQYARSRGLSRHTLYAARQMLRRARSEPSVGRRPRVLRAANKPVAESAFAAVKLSALCTPSGGAAPRLRAQLPNGVRLELMWADAALLATAIEALAGR